MIRRPNGPFHSLIAQADHAALAGVLASHIGNSLFDALPSEVVAAIAAHDAGWSLHDDSPTLNTRGLPLHVFETPVPWAIRLWATSTERAESFGDYAALLVSLHQLNLSDLLTRSRNHSPRDAFDLNKFQHKQLERQESFRRRLGTREDLPLQLGLAKAGADAVEDRLRFHFRMLSLCDSLSLELCCGRTLFPDIHAVHPRASADAITIHTDMLDASTLRIGPWPFDAPSLTVPVPCKNIDAGPFHDEAAYQSCLRAARIDVLELRLRPK